MPHRRSFLGAKIKRLRQGLDLSQVDAAARLGISASYLNLIEHNRRPITVSLLFKFSELFGVDPQTFAEADETRLADSLRQMFADGPLKDRDIPDEEIADVVATAPSLCQSVIDLHSAYVNGQETIQALSEQLSDDAVLPATSYEMRAALASIRSFSEILYQHADISDAERQKFIGIVVKESTRLSDIVDRVLDTTDNGRKESLLEVRPLADHLYAFVETHNNYFPSLEAQAAKLHDTVDRDPWSLAELLRRELVSRHGVAIEWLSTHDGDSLGPAFTEGERVIKLSDELPPNQVNFELACCLARHLCHDTITDLIAKRGQIPEAAAPLIGRALVKYFAGAVLMPYDPFLDYADAQAYDIDRLANRFGVSFEQCCHRLVSLNRPGASGIPFHLAKVDIAGNLLTRYSGSGLRIPHFGGICPRWNIHGAFSVPGEIVTQLAETGDGSAYFCIARTVERRVSAYGEPRNRIALGLGCSTAHASRWIYARDRALDATESMTPIGTNCRVCERHDCSQRVRPSLTGIEAAEPDAAPGP